MSLEMLKKRFEQKKAKKPRLIRGLLGWNYPLLNFIREWREKRWRT